MFLKQLQSLSNIQKSKFVEQTNSKSEKIYININSSKFEILLVNLLLKDQKQSFANLVE